MNLLHAGHVFFENENGVMWPWHPPYAAVERGFGAIAHFNALLEGLKQGLGCKESKGSGIYIESFHLFEIFHILVHLHYKL